MRLRAPVLDDAPAVFEVITARDIADLGVPDFTLGDLHDEWRSSQLDLQADARVVEADGGLIVGYAIVRARGALAVVSPAHEGRGIGTLLLHWAEERERERGARRHRQSVPPGSHRALELLVGAGYRRVRSYWRMVRSLHDVPASVVPYGVRLRSLDLARDSRQLHELDAASFAGVAEYEPEPLEAFVDEHLCGHDLAPELSVVAEQDQAIVGFLLSRRWESERAGYVDLLAVHPSVRRRGLGSAMLVAAFTRFAHTGLAEAQLGVASDNPRALKLYERLGMTPRFQVDSYERESRG